jgi:hypothetical protein
MTDRLEGLVIARMGPTDDITYPPEKQPTHDDPDLILCYALAWADYLIALLACPEPITQECVDAAYDDYCIAVVTCETLHPPRVA